MLTSLICLVPMLWGSRRLSEVVHLNLWTQRWLTICSIIMKITIARTILAITRISHLTQHWRQKTSLRSKREFLQQEELGIRKTSRDQGRLLRAKNQRGPSSRNLCLSRTFATSSAVTPLIPWNPYQKSQKINNLIAPSPSSESTISLKTTLPSSDGTIKTKQWSDCLLR